MQFGMPILLETPAIEDACALCSELGLSFVELNLNFPACTADSLDPQRLMALKRRYGIFFTIHMEEDWDPFHFNLSVHRAWQESLRRILMLAQTVGVPTINMHLPKGVYITLPEGRVYLYESCRADYLAAVRALRDLCEEELAGTSTRMAVENTNGFAPHEQEALEILLQSPVFGLTLDVGHLHTAEHADLAFYEKHHDRLIHMHGHDAQRKRDHMPLGTGDVDLHARFAWAEENDARVVLEIKTIAALRESVAWLHEKL